MTESQVDMLTQIGMKKATEFAGKLGDARLTVNWVNRYNGYFAGYMDLQAETYQAEEVAKLQEKAKKINTPKVMVPPQEDDFADLLG